MRIGDAVGRRQRAGGVVSEANAGMRLSDEQRLDWLLLIRSDDVGARTFRALINHYGGHARRWRRFPNSPAAAAPKVRLASPRARTQRELKAAQALGVTFVALGEPDYPRRLQMIDDAPLLMAARGHPAVLKLPAVALVGARNASAAGVRFAERLARQLRAARP